jgi:hypothetical protein
MKWQFVITQTICQTEIPALLDSWVTNTPSVKILCPHPPKKRKKERRKKEKKERKKVAWPYIFTKT